MALPFKVWFDKKIGIIRFRVDGTSDQTPDTSHLPYIGLWTLSREHFVESVIPNIEGIIGDGYREELLTQYDAAELEYNKFFSRLRERITKSLSQAEMTSAEVARKVRVRDDVASKCLGMMAREGLATDIAPNGGAHTMRWRLT